MKILSERLILRENVERVSNSIDRCVTGGACSRNLLAKNSSNRWIMLYPVLSRSSRINSHFGNRTNETIPRDFIRRFWTGRRVTMFKKGKKENEAPEGKYQTASRRLVTVNWGSWSKLRLAPEFHLSVRSSIPLLLSLSLSLLGRKTTMLLLLLPAVIPAGIHSRPLQSYPTYVPVANGTVFDVDLCRVTTYREVYIYQRRHFQENALGEGERARNGVRKKKKIRTR